MLKSFLCPKCGALLSRSGEIEIAGETFPVFQCDTCIVPWELDGETFEAAYTFAVDAGGTPFDPASDGSLPL